jgi:curved DNA-binding protein CbpA
MSTDSHDPHVLLGVALEASDEEVRRAYKRVRAAYASEATYGLLPPEEVQEIRDRIEAAYGALMAPDRPGRRPGGGRLDPTPTPPVGNLALPAGFLAGVTAPPRDEAFEEMNVPEPSAADAPESDGGGVSAGGSGSVSVFAGAGAASTADPSPFAAAEPRTEPRRDPSEPRLDLDLRADTPVSGDLLRRVREARNVDIRDVSHHTKVSVTQLAAIEREAFASLPAVVYVRGFVGEYARYLRFPDPAQAARSYVERYRAYLDAHGGEQ